MGINGPLFYVFLPIFLVMVGIEWLYSRRRGQPVYFGRDTFVTLAIAVGQRIIAVLKAAGMGVCAHFMWTHRLTTIPLKTVWGVGLLFLGVDFCYYWFHRASHEVRWLWATHAVHHSTNRLNILAADRLGWTGSISGGFVFYLPLMGLGFHPAAVAGMLALGLFYQSWLHTEFIPKLGLLEGIINTPSNHRVHHARNADYLDRNYGGVLAIWDRLFGTYVEERADEPCEYGLVKRLDSANPLYVALHEWIAIARDLRTMPARYYLGYLLGPPGWSHDGSRLTSDQLRQRYHAQKAAQAAAATPPAAQLPFWQPAAPVFFEPPAA
jgi:sterol desaturase/sphingolipid hydroxylase (fatty acid hydroxylase superfamily)